MNSGSCSQMLVSSKKMASVRLYCGKPNPCLEPVMVRLSLVPSQPWRVLCDATGTPRTRTVLFWGPPLHSKSKMVHDTQKY